MGTPTAERVVQILDFLTTHPGRGFTASELARQVRLNKATTHRILGTLTDRALLMRDPDTREYRLGTALVAMGTVAERNIPALTLAKREADRLAEQHEAECVILAATNEELLIAYHAGVPGPLSATFQEGQRQPLAPPMGTVVVAWTGDEAVEAWLDRPANQLTEDERQRYRDSLEAVRRRGYAVAIGISRLYQLQDLYTNADLHTPHGRRELSLALAVFARDNYPPTSEELSPDTEISGVTAPIFGPAGTMLYAIGITGVDYRVRDIPTLSRAVVRAAGRVTAAIDGQPPPNTRSNPPTRRTTKSRPPARPRTSSSQS